MMTQATASQPQAQPAYADHLAHLVDELRALDRLIQLRVAELRLRPMPQRLALDRQVYISHEEVACLLDETGAVGDAPADLIALREQIASLQNEISAKVAASTEQGLRLPLVQLADTFGLSLFEVLVVVVCLAPELDRKYDRIYAYLQDDITRKRPSVDLLLMLLCDSPTDRWRFRALLTPHGALFRAGIAQAVDDPQSPSGSSDLARFLRLDPRIVNYLLGHNLIDETLLGIATLYQPEQSLDHVPVEEAIKARLLRLVEWQFAGQAANRRALALYLHGPAGVGRRGLALGICEYLECSLLYLDVDVLLGRDADVARLLRLALREGLLLQAGVYLDNTDGLLRDDERAKALLKTLAQLVAEYGWLVFLAGSHPWSAQGIFEQAVFQSVALPLPEAPLRVAAWRSALEQHFSAADPSWADLLAERFRLTPGQIQAAVESAAQQVAMRGGQPGIELDDLYRACRSQFQHRLGDLAVKIEPRYTWHDLVLPEDRLAQLEEICDHAKHRQRVFDAWGFERKLAHGKGLSALFTGPPGTGKTMAAEVIAHALQLDLFKVDLAGVVSKYIGETEKHLGAIFREAEHSNAILFFDEADALFGKRTEIADAHDRYANIETSYLLQRMEAYAGIVILATNLRENMDPAFTRRLRFVVEFPFPDEASRRRIWQAHFPPEAPLSAEVDYAFLARKFAIAGGNIKNIVLSAAFYAAADGGVIRVEHILRGARREFEKVGKLWTTP